jgi:indolepyruvate ferredoxin oxidoreductase
VVGGVGGTGVITIGQLLGMAAHLEGKGVVTQDAGGLAQKGGATWSHIQIADTPDNIFTTKVDMAKADLIIGCDAIVAANKSTLAAMQPGRTYVALNSHATPTAAFVRNTEWQFPAGGCESAIAAAVGQEALGVLDAEFVAVQTLGDSIYANPLLLGYAWQKGRVPLQLESILRAMELNGVQVQNNKAAFHWGRQCAIDLRSVLAQFEAREVVQIVKKPALGEVVAQRVEFLTGYQNAAYAQAYADFVEKVRQAEAPLGKTVLSESVARYLFKLMAYKDEYEVARLHTGAAFASKLADMFEGDYHLQFHMAPPVLGAGDTEGVPRKKTYGPWMLSLMRVLASCKGVRGTVWDVFGRSEERKQERALVEQYRAAIESLLPRINAANLDAAVAFARLPETIRGYGHVKTRNLAAARLQWDALLAAVR